MTLDWLTMALQFRLPLSSITVMCALDMRGPMRPSDLT